MKPNFETIRRSSMSIIAYHGGSSIVDKTDFDQLPPEEKMNRIYDEVQRIFKVNFWERDGTYPYLIPRKIFCYVCRSLDRLIVLRMIGKKLDGRDHTSVINSVSSARDMLKWNDALFMEYWLKWTRNAPFYMVPNKNYKCE